MHANKKSAVFLKHLHAQNQIEIVLPERVSRIDVISSQCNVWTLYTLY